MSNNLNNYEEAIEFIRAVEAIAKAYDIEVNSVLSTLGFFCDKSEDKLTTKTLISLFNEFSEMGIEERAKSLGFQVKKVN